MLTAFWAVAAQDPAAAVAILKSKTAPAAAAPAATAAPAAVAAPAAAGNRMYCWTHGAKAHISKECLSKKPGHKDSATFKNQMGGTKA